MRTVKRILKIITIAVVLVALGDAAFVLGLPKKMLPTKEEPADAVIVLGAAPNSPAIRYRAGKGVELYHSGLAKSIILTGGNTSSKDETEAQNMARYITGGQPTFLPLVLENESSNTFENLENSRRLVPDASRVIIVSDGCHLPRAFLIAKRVGFTEVYWDAPSGSYYKPSELVWYYGREMVAILAYAPRLIK